MSKLIDVNDYVGFITYAKKYGVCDRKVRRYVKKNIVDNVVIDGVPFIKDIEFPILKTDHRVKDSDSIVPILTKHSDNVQIVTLDKDNPTENQEVNIVPIVTLPNVPIVTMHKSNVTKLTIQNRLDELLEIPELNRSIEQFQEMEDIKKKL